MGEPTPPTSCDGHCHQPGRDRSATIRMHGARRGLHLFLIIVCHRGREPSCVLFSARFCGHARRGSTSTSDTGPTGGHLGRLSRTFTH